MRTALLRVTLIAVTGLMGCGSDKVEDNGDSTPIPSQSGLLVANHTRVNVEVPSAAITAAKTALHIAYGHTSHGSQLVTGMEAMASDDDVYAFNRGGEDGALDFRDTPFSDAADLGSPNMAAWAAATRVYLEENPDINVVIWSWCGQVSSSTESDIERYLGLMNVSRS